MLRTLKGLSKYKSFFGLSRSRCCVSLCTVRMGGGGVGVGWGSMYVYCFFFLRRNKRRTQKYWSDCI